MIVSSKLRFWCLILVAILVSAETNCLRREKIVAREQAIKQVKVSSLPDWQEAISEDGRFRVLFPGSFKRGVERGTSEKGFKLIQPDTNWFAYYVDYDRPMPNDESYLRNAYKGSVSAITRNGRFLLGQRDVFLNNRLGSEFVVDGPGRISYGRAFVAGRRMYILNVDRKVGDAIVNASIPADIKQFFDSFTYWD